MIPGRHYTESAAYRKSRDELLEAEIALKDQRERVAALRRKLPLDTEIQDYEFHEGPADLNQDGPITTVRLSGLFDDPTSRSWSINTCTAAPKNGPARVARCGSMDSTAWLIISARP